MSWVWSWKTAIILLVAVIVIVFFWDIACGAVESSASKAKGAL